MSLELKELTVDIRGYEVGPIAAEAAFTSDFAVAAEVSMPDLVNYQEVERRVMDERPGMLMKYMPAGYSPVTGEVLTGGRYLFDTWDSVREYRRFTTEELEFEPGVKFWDRLFFLGVDRHIWRVAGAHNFTPLTEHAVDRFERYTYTGGDPRPELERAWPAMRDAAEESGLGGAWLLYQPEENQIAIHTIAGRVTSGEPETAAEASLAAIAGKPPLGAHLPAALRAEKIFDRSEMIVSLWLPRSRRVGGRPTANPMTPPLPAWTVAPQQVSETASV
ncbi:hypothetical protein [Nocardia huaxiensis]|uniref:hypothetical protein n=1 Tax=Nocardia huaxiensis TaxID=2755382 RepID=UPI001E56402F|nr:hypothetical protein [Nocardia huaxiensis]UFS95284.1 hypothetical protein LPY97_32075 [Nocardia huaxiensis]